MLPLYFLMRLMLCPIESRLDTVWRPIAFVKDHDRPRKVNEREMQCNVTHSGVASMP